MAQDAEDCDVAAAVQLGQSEGGQDNEEVAIDFSMGILSTTPAMSAPREAPSYRDLRKRKRATGNFPPFVRYLPNSAVPLFYLFQFGCGANPETLGTEQDIEECGAQTTAIQVIAIPSTSASGSPAIGGNCAQHEFPYEI